MKSLTSIAIASDGNAHPPPESPGGYGGELLSDDNNQTTRPPRTISLGLVLRIPDTSIPEVLDYLNGVEDTQVVFALQSKLRLHVAEVPWS